jgi:hypothetical protein
MIPILRPIFHRRVSLDGYDSVMQPYDLFCDGFTLSVFDFLAGWSTMGPPINEQFGEVR